MKENVKRCYNCPWSWGNCQKENQKQKNLHMACSFVEVLSSAAVALESWLWVIHVTLTGKCADLLSHNSPIACLLLTLTWTKTFLKTKDLSYHRSWVLWYTKRIVL